MYAVERCLPGYGWDKVESFETMLEAAQAIEDLRDEDEGDGFCFDYRVTAEGQVAAWNTN